MTKEELTYELQAMPEGWWRAFGDLLVEELWSALVEDNLENVFIINQVKEKYGSLRIYVSNATEKIFSIINKYEYISEHVCIYCGQPDVGLVQTGWIEPICRSCFPKIYISSANYDDLVDTKDTTLKNYYNVNVYKNDKVETETYYIKPLVNKIRERYV